MVTTDLGPIARDLNLSPEAVQRTVELLDEGNTVPFITRYRKDQTGGLDEEQIRRIQEGANRLRLLQERKQSILKSIQTLLVEVHGIVSAQPIVQGPKARRGPGT